MSRLIFEGDTTKRFGEKFPRPFIEQIRAYDNGVEVDIAFYFKVPNEQEAVNAFKKDLKDVQKFSQSIVLSAVDGRTLDKLKSSKNFDSLLKKIQNLQVSIDSSDPDVIKTETINFSQFENSQDDFYNLEGERFLKIYQQIDIDYNSSGEMYITCFTKNGLGSIYYDGQTSDLIFEKLLNEDRTISTDPIIAFLEQNGNFYYQTPLMSLARTYHKTDDYGHTELIKQFSDVLQSYSIDESNDILTTLETQKDNPRLLIILKKKIDGFTDKSPATTMGRLYSQMASNIVLADTLINGQERVSKRQFTNTKVKDFRNLLLPILQKTEQNSDFYSVSAGDRSFIPEPSISRRLLPFLYVSLDPVEKDLDVPFDRDQMSWFKIITNGYYFVDYEKILNYKSEISKILNPYNIEQIFGRGSLANFFHYKYCDLNINYNPIAERPDEVTYNLSYSSEQKKPTFLNIFDSSVDNFFLKMYSGSVGYVRKFASVDKEELRFSLTEESDAQGNPNKEVIFSQFVQRYPNTIKNIGDYRISCFELTHIEDPNVFLGLLAGERPYTLNIAFEDTTMQFYEQHIRQKITSLNNSIRKYTNFAEDFCSFNNLDNRFNDFFIESIRDQFTEPYPWEEAPLYYVLFSQMINASIDEETLDRKREGIFLDFDSIKNAAKDIVKNISPETGDLNSLNEFSILLDSLVRKYFLKGSGLDQKYGIYRDTGDSIASDSYTLQVPSTTLTMSRVDSIDYSNYIDTIGVEFEEEEESESPTGERPDPVPTDLPKLLDTEIDIEEQRDPGADEEGGGRAPMITSVFEPEVLALGNKEIDPDEGIS